MRPLTHQRGVGPSLRLPSFSKAIHGYNQPSKNSRFLLIKNTHDQFLTLCVCVCVSVLEKNLGRVDTVMNRLMKLQRERDRSELIMSGGEALRKRRYLFIHQTKSELCEVQIEGRSDSAIAHTDTSISRALSRGRNSSRRSRARTTNCLENAGGEKCVVRERRSSVLSLM